MYFFQMIAVATTTPTCEDGKKGLKITSLRKMSWTKIVTWQLLSLSASRVSIRNSSTEMNSLGDTKIPCTLIKIPFLAFF